MVDITPIVISLRINSPALTPMLRARSPTVTPSEIRTTRLEALGVVISVLRCSLPGNARRFLGKRAPRISRSASKSTPSFLTTRFFLIGRAPGLSDSVGGIAGGIAGAGPTTPGRAKRGAGIGRPGGAGRTGGA